MITLAGFPRHFWPVIAVPFSPVSYTLQLLASDMSQVKDEALVIDYDPPHKCEDTMELLAALGYAHMPRGNIEAICAILSSQAFPDREKITAHPRNPVKCEAEEYQKMLQLFFTRQFTEQSEAEIEYWFNRSSSLLSARSRTDPNLPNYIDSLRRHKERAKLGVEACRSLYPELLLRLKAHFVSASTTEKLAVHLRSDFFKRD